MKNVTFVEAKSHFSALLAEVEAGQEIAVTRHGRVVARLVPDRPRKDAHVNAPNHDLFGGERTAKRQRRYLRAGRGFETLI